MFEPYLAQWNLTPDGDPIVTHSGRLLPVRHGGVAAMLKLANDEDERFGGAVMEWWDGDGAARVLARDDHALLLERAQGTASLAEMARNGHDDEAARILCAVAARLHAPRGKPLPELVTLPHWFRDLAPGAVRHAGVRDGILGHCARVAGELLAAQGEIPSETVVLHGDLHHGNVLDFGARGWLAIDPKRLIGDRAFDYANIFTNPDLDDPTRPVATTPGCFERRLELVCEASGIERHVLLRWIFAWTGLSAVWYLDDGDPAAVDLFIAERAAAALGR